jgi:hypothetical protein
MKLSVANNLPYNERLKPTLRPASAEHAQVLIYTQKRNCWRAKDQALEIFEGVSVFWCRWMWS